MSINVEHYYHLRGELERLNTITDAKMAFVIENDMYTEDQKNRLLHFHEKIRRDRARQIHKEARKEYEKIKAQYEDVKAGETVRSFMQLTKALRGASEADIVAFNTRLDNVTPRELLEFYFSENQYMEAVIAQRFRGTLKGLRGIGGGRVEGSGIRFDDNESESLQREMLRDLSEHVELFFRSDELHEAEQLFSEVEATHPRFDEHEYKKELAHKYNIQEPSPRPFRDYPINVRGAAKRAVKESFHSKDLSDIERAESFSAGLPIQRAE